VSRVWTRRATLKIGAMTLIRIHWTKIASPTTLSPANQWWTHLQTTNQSSSTYKKHKTCKKSAANFPTWRRTSLKPSNKIFNSTKNSKMPIYSTRANLCRMKKQKRWSWNRFRIWKGSWRDWIRWIWNWRRKLMYSFDLACRLEIRKGGRLRVRSDSLSRITWIYSRESSS